MIQAPAGREGEHGFAVLTVLWALVPLSLLFTIMTSSARSDAHLASNLRDAAILEAKADADLASGVFELLRGQPATGVVVEALGGRVNPNLASAELLSALLHCLGASTREADAVSIAIVDWRMPGARTSRGGAKQAEYRGAGMAYGPPSEPFETLAELQYVLGMRPELWTALRPYLSLYANTDPTPSLATALVQTALVDAGALEAVPAALQPYRIWSSAASIRPGTVNRQAVVRIGNTEDGRGWQILYWGDRSNDE